MANQFEHNDVAFAGGQTILEYYGMKGTNKWAYVGYLSLFWCAFVVFAWAALSFVRHQRR
jgi:ATP-binding cassette subfamily G (WHITE) protein 2